MKEYKFDSVQAFYKELKATKREYLDYKADCAEWEKAYGGKATNPKSIREQLRQKEQVVKEREASREDSLVYGGMLPVYMEHVSFLYVA